MLDFTRKPGQSYTDAIRCLNAIDLPIAGRFHQSVYSSFEIDLPSPASAVVFVIPLEAAMAIEEAGYTIRLVGRLNG